jgi:antitoxin (DNA-binding transcriptional repressor) of toxin-antitoxin stability system
MEDDLTEIGAFEAKNKLSWLLDRVEQGEEIIITRHGRPVARLVRSNTGIDRSQAHAALQRMRDRAGQAGLGPFHWATLKADRDASRP